VSGALGFGERMHPLGARLRRILDGRIVRRTRLSVLGVGAAFLLGVVLLPGLPSSRSEGRLNAGEIGTYEEVDSSRGSADSQPLSTLSPCIALGVGCSMGNGPLDSCDWWDKVDGATACGSQCATIARAADAEVVPRCRALTATMDIPAALCRMLDHNKIVGARS
jgi:hypothetical protein